MPLVAATLIALPSVAAEKFGVFETISASSVSFDETTAALETAIAESGLELHAALDVRVPDDAHQARVYILTSPDFVIAARSEPPRTISAQVLRIGVFTVGDEQKTMINMTNPVSHAMVFYAESPNYHELVVAARHAATRLRALAEQVPGELMSEQRRPMRKESHYNKYKGDGPARTMTKFRTWEKSQLLIDEDIAENFEDVIERTIARLDDRAVVDASFPYGWEKVVLIRVRDDAVYLGLTNPYIEDRVVAVNSEFRSKEATELSPYPGVDHVATLPAEVLIVKEAGKASVLHYGQMWRMQLYLWDSGYRAFTRNVNMPGKITKSIDELLQAPED